MTVLMQETRVLFLLIKTIRVNNWHPAVFESLEQLCKSSNAAISNQAHCLTSQLCRKESYS